MSETKVIASGFRDDEEILDKEALAKLLKVEMKTVNHLLYSKQLPRFRCGREYRFVKSQILAWVVLKSRPNEWGQSK